MRIRIGLGILAGLLASAGVYAANLPPGFAEEQVVTGINPTCITGAPDGRIFIGEKNGTIRILRDGALLPAPWISLPVGTYNERGLNGIVLDPDFDLNGYVYLYYTVPEANHNRVSRFTASGDFIPLHTEQILLDLDTLTAGVHNGGGMAFGPDGCLYIGTGDGSTPGNAQRLDRLLGKILRIRPDGTIPEDNPWYQTLPGSYRTIWAIGLRNPFSLAFEPGTGRLFVSDVGNAAAEEVNVAVAGKNYGWPLAEGYLPGTPPVDQYQNPLYQYNHATGCAVVGAAFYAPEVLTFPAAYHGRFFFADYCNGFIKVMNPGTGSIVSTFATGIRRALKVWVAPDGDLYYLSRGGDGTGSIPDNTGAQDGSLWRVYYAGTGVPYIAVHPAGVLASVGEAATFQVQASGADTLRYRWFRDGSPLADEAGPVLWLDSLTLADSGAVFTCQISNAAGTVTSHAALLRVTANQRPVPVIAPLPVTYRAGDTLRLRGAAVDPETGPVLPEYLYWQIDFHHDRHVHPASGGVAGADWFFKIPDLGEVSPDVWYRVHLTAYDPIGLYQSVHVDIYPARTFITVGSHPPGLTAYLDGLSLRTPSAVPGVVNMKRTLEVPQVQVIGDTLYRFEQWQDGDKTPVKTFGASDTGNVYRFIARQYTLGTGTGLLGQYYHEPDGLGFKFDRPPLFERLDPQVAFGWGDTAADTLLGGDDYAVRWLGYVEPVFSGEYTFIVNSDDGVRLWVDHHQLIDQWKLQALTRSAGRVYLEAGHRYPIRLEYFESKLDAAVTLSWESALQPLEIIPQRQLYPVSARTAASVAEIWLYPVPASGILYAEVITPTPETLQAELTDARGRMYRQWVLAPADVFTRYPLDLTGVGAGLYYMRFWGESGFTQTQPVLIRP